MLRLRATSAAVAAVALTLWTAPLNSAVAASAVDPADPLAGVPFGAPPAATAAEPVLPAPSHSVWPFSEAFPRTEGAGRLSGGAQFWTDFVYDDHGAASPAGFPLSTAAMTSDLAPTQGIAGYAAADARGNGADIFRAAVGVTSDASYWRVDWNTLADPSVPIAEWALDTDGSTATGGSAWPAAAGVTSAGIDKALVVSSKALQLFSITSGATTVQTLPLSDLTVDRDVRSFVVRIPRSVLPVSGTWRARLAAGVADGAGKSFAEPDWSSGAGALLSQLQALPHVYNVSFRSHDQEPPVYTDGGVTENQVAALQAAFAATPLNSTTGLDGLARFVTGNFWMDDHQADALASGGDVSAFSVPITWSSLQAGVSTAEPQPRGYTNRWYVSRLNLGQGVVQNSGSGSGDLLPNYLGRVQPYAVYVPTGVDLTRPIKLTWIEHSLGVNLNQYGALDPQQIQQECQDRASICATTEGFGPDGWYFDEAEQDFWSVWHALATSYRLDDQHTVMSGYSMGGWASYKLVEQHPDLYSQSMPLEGPPVCGIRVAELSLTGQEVDAPAGSNGTAPEQVHCDQDGSSAPLLANVRWVPYVMTQGATDELVPLPSNVQQALDLKALGYRYQLFLLANDHLVYATEDRFAGVVATLGKTPTLVHDPATVNFSWYPDLRSSRLGIGPTTAYWLSGFGAASTGPGVVATVTAKTAGIADPAVTPVPTGPAAVTTPLPAVQSGQLWQLGPASARHDRLALSLSGVSALTVDARRAGLSCPTVTVTSTAPTALTLRRLPAHDALRPVGGSAVQVDRSGTATLHLPAGRSTVVCGSMVNGAFRSTAASGSGGSDRGLADTGGLGPTGLALAATLLALAVASVRRRRIGL